MGGLTCSHIPGKSSPHSIQHIQRLMQPLRRLVGATEQNVTGTAHISHTRRVSKAIMGCPEVVRSAPGSQAPLARDLVNGVE